MKRQIKYECPETSIATNLKVPGYVLFACSLIGLSVAVFVGRPVMAKEMNAWQLLPRPQRFTELYFTDFRSLPTSVKTNADQQISFTVHNSEQRSTTYHYRLIVTLAHNGTQRQVGDGSFTLTPDQSRSLQQTIVIPPIDGRAAIAVSLDYRGIAFGDTALSAEHQSVSYWTTVSGVAKGRSIAL